MANDKMLTPQDIAAKTGMSIGWIRQNIKNEKLRAIDIGGRYFIEYPEYNRWKANLRPKGRPRKAVSSDENISSGESEGRRR